MLSAVAEAVTGLTRPINTASNPNVVVPSISSSLLFCAFSSSNLHLIPSVPCNRSFQRAEVALK